MFVTVTAAPTLILNVFSFTSSWTRLITAADHVVPTRTSLAEALKAADRTSEPLRQPHTDTRTRTHARTALHRTTPHPHSSHSSRRLLVG